MTKKNLNKKNKKQNKNKHKDKKFFSFISEKSQLIDILFIGIICFMGYVFLKIFYPYPATMSDSGGYVVSAVQDMFSFYRPFGYSAFLQFMYSISSSIHAVFIIQMLLYFLSTVFFALTIKYFFSPNNKYLWYVLLFFISFSPVAFFLANSIMSDMLFSGLIYFILTGFIFMVMKKSWTGFILYSFALFFSLHVRYSAMIFPFILIPFFFLIKGKVKWLYIVVSILIFLIFHRKLI